MAYLEGNGGSGIFVGADSSTFNSATVRIKGLGQTAENYDGFGVYYQSGSNSASGWTFVRLWNSNSGTTETSPLTINGLTPGVRTYFVAAANFRGTWYYGGESWVTHPAAPTPGTPSLSIGTIKGKRINVSVTTGAETTSVRFDHYTTMPWGDRYKTVSIGSYQTYTYTFDVPSFSTAYRVDCQATSQYGTTSGWSNTLSFNSGPPNPELLTLRLNMVSGRDAFYNLTANEYTKEIEVDYSWVSGSLDEVVTPGQSFYVFTAPNYGEEYKIDFRARDYSQLLFGDWTGWQTFRTQPADVTSIRESARTKNSIEVSWGPAAGATSYRVIAKHNVTGAQAFSTTTSNTVLNCTGLAMETFYKISVQAISKFGDYSENVKEIVIATREGTPPEVYSELPKGNTQNVTLIARAIDRSSGVNRLEAYVSGRNIADGWARITKYPTNIMETENISFVFQNDGSGLKFVVGSTYYFKVMAYDNDGNSSVTGVMSLVITNARPENFSWNVNWTSGAAFNLKASQWNKFTQSINDFRVYKNLSAIQFTEATTGAGFTAAMYNEARNAIAAMNSNVPPAVTSKTSQISPTTLNSISNSLNAIT